MGLVSKKCIEFVKDIEGFEPSIKPDMVGVPTLGYGMTGAETKGLTKITEKQATIMLEDLLNNKYGQAIKKDLDRKKVALNQNEFDALVSMSYNIGIYGLLGSTLYRHVCSGIKDLKTITNDFLMWNKATVDNKMVAVPGLTRRRSGEAKMFLSSSSASAKINYCIQWQKWYNQITQTTTPISCDGIYGKSTQTSLDALLTYIKQSKKYKYCLEFQKFYNSVTQTSTPISQDGLWGGNTENAYKMLNKLIKGEY